MDGAEKIPCQSVGVDLFFGNETVRTACELFRSYSGDKGDYVSIMTLMRVDTSMSAVITTFSSRTDFGTRRAMTRAQKVATNLPRTTG